MVLLETTAHLAQVILTCFSYSFLSSLLLLYICIIIFVSFLFLFSDFYHLQTKPNTGFGTSSSFGNTASGFGSSGFGSTSTSNGFGASANTGFSGGGFGAPAGRLLIFTYFLIKIWRSSFCFWWWW